MKRNTAKNNVVDVDTATALAVVGAEKQVEESAVAKQLTREGEIAGAYETAGIIKSLNFVGKVVTVTSLVQLDKVKKSKGYKGLGTWQEYCDYVGLDRHSIDQQLLNLNTFGQEFLETVSNFGVGYREMRKLRQLSADGGFEVTAGTIEIAGESIPLDPEHKEDLQAALERLLDDTESKLSVKDRLLRSKDEVIERMDKQLSRLDKKAATKGLSAEEHAFLEQMEQNRIGFDGYMLKADPRAIMAAIDPSLMTPRMRAMVISTIHYMKMQILSAYDTAVENFGDPEMNPELMADFMEWTKKSAVGGSRLLLC
jgi:hypothetical protein